MREPRAESRELIDQLLSLPHFEESLPIVLTVSARRSKRRQRMRFSLYAEQIEPRTLLTGPVDPPSGSPSQPPQLTGNVDVSLNYQPLTTELVFSGVVDRSVEGLARFNSSVPFRIDGNSSGPATLRLTFPNGDVHLQDVNGVFSVEQSLNTRMAVDNLMPLKAELIDPISADIVAHDLATESLHIEQFRFREYFGKIGGRVDPLMSSQIRSQVSSLFAPMLTDATLTDVALQRISSGQSDRTVESEVAWLREQLMTAQSRMGTEVEAGLRFGLTTAIEGDQMNHRFAMGAAHPGAPEFAASLAASKAAYNADFSSAEILRMVDFSASLPSTAELQTRLPTMRTATDILDLVSNIPIEVGIKGPTMRVRDGVDFNGSTSFSTSALDRSDAKLSAFRVESSLNFSPVSDGAPVFLGRKTRGTVSSFFERTIDSNGTSSDSTGIGGGFRVGLEY